MEFISRLESFLQLRNKLLQLPEQVLSDLKNQAGSKNPWFTPANIDLAFEGIIHLLKEDNFKTWAAKYAFENTTTKNIGVIAAGNIPMVGFHDVLCVLMSGHNLHIKLSHQDDILLPFLFQLLIDINRQWTSVIHQVDKLSNVDALVATGSDNTARYFEYYFRHIPLLIRKNRTSIAVISGAESTDELTKLGSDIYQYFGFGCRNVAKILLPQQYELPYLLDHFNGWVHLAENHKFVNNYNYHRAIFSMEGIPYLDNGFSIFTQNFNLVSPTTVIYFDFYKDNEDAMHYINGNESKIQCIVGRNGFSQKNVIPFGKTQCPDIWDYADDVDTMAFLSTI